jgi:hypothetical protein
MSESNTASPPKSTDAGVAHVIRDPETTTAELCVLIRLDAKKQLCAADGAKPLPDNVSVAAGLATSGTTPATCTRDATETSNSKETLA